MVATSLKRRWESVRLRPLPGYLSGPRRMPRIMPAATKNASKASPAIQSRTICHGFGDQRGGLFMAGRDAAGSGEQDDGRQRQR
jgi:hypothetical protein